MLKIPYNCSGEPIVTNTYRNTKYNPHLGVDYAMPRRTAIIAATDGRVVAARYWLPKEDDQKKRQWLANTETDPYKKILLGKMIYRSLKTEDYGNYVKIDHGKGMSTLYAHLDEPIVFEGQNVKEGELIGYSDSSGNSSGDHLHYEIRKNDIVIDPNNFDYGFIGEMPKELETVFLDEPIVVDVTAKEGLNIRNGPNTLSSRVGILRYKSNIEVVGYCSGEVIDENDKWWKTKSYVYVWSGGTSITPTSDMKGKNMKLAEHEAKAKELEQEKSVLESRKADLESKKLELEKLEKDLEADELTFVQKETEFNAEVIEVEETIQTPIEEVKEEVKPEEPVVEPQVEEQPVVAEPEVVEETETYSIKEEWPIEVKLAVKQINDLISANKEYLK